MRGFRVWHTKLNRYLKDEEFYIGSDGQFDVHTRFFMHRPEEME